MILLSQKECVVIIVDIQEKLLNAVFNKYIIQNNSEKLSKAIDILGLPVFITEQYPKGLGSTIDCIKTNLTNAKYYEKVEFNSLENETLLKDLKEINCKQVVLCGIESHICVHQTAAGLIENGYEVTVLSDVSGSRSFDSHTLAMKNMRDYGVCIKSLEMVLFELLGSSKHSNFKEIQALIK